MEKSVLKECNKSKLLSIYKKLNLKTENFNLLSESDQHLVLLKLLDDGYKPEIITHKGFDLVKNKFFARKVFRDINGYNAELIYFENFDEFYFAFKKDIYENSCYLGFEFTDEMLRKYHIKKERLNFKCYIKDKISKYTFAKELKRKIKEDEEVRICLNECIEELESFNPNWGSRAFQDLDEYITKPQFKEVIFSLLIRKYKEEIKRSLIDYYCKMPLGYWSFDFLTILLTYGVDTCKYVIENLNTPYSYNTNRKIINGHKDFLERYENGDLKLKTVTGYNFRTQTYCISTFTDDGKMIHEYSHTMHYLCFEEFANALNGNLCGAILKNAPIKREEVEKYKTDDSTVFPVKWEEADYKITKKFDDGKFVVVQKWYDQYGALIFKKEHSFLFFCDFAYFLNNDLSKSDFIMLDGIDNIRKNKIFKLENIKVRSAYQSEQQIEQVFRNKPTIFEASEKNELSTIECFNLIHKDEIDNQITVSYISDIHLAHRFDAYNCYSEEDKEYVLRTITKKLAKTSSCVNIFAGDTCDNIQDFAKFFTKIDKLDANETNHYFVVLGNHELWSLDNKKCSEIINEYRHLFDDSFSKRFHLLHNNAYYLIDKRWFEISENDLKKLDNSQLKELTKESKVVIFGGIGFSGRNDVFCSKQGIYLRTIDRDEEIKESKKFEQLYLKAIECFKDRNLIVATHMPLADWSENVEYVNNVVYVNGHNHRNYYFDNGNKRIYADNQVGYKGKNVEFKTLSIDFTYDYFSDYKDGIYEISKKDYRLFYRALNVTLMFNNNYKSVLMIKKHGTYAFFVRNNSGELLLLNGGKAQKMFTKDINYFYDNISIFTKSLKTYLSAYLEKEEKISKYVKSIGGTGTIHGTIVDIDFYNHLYVNPYDGSVTPYYANSIVDKYTYSNLPSLLKYECPNIYENFLNNRNDDNLFELISLDSNYELDKRKTYYGDTDIYKISRIVKGLQYMSKYNVVRIWNLPNLDDVNYLDEGKKILELLLYPEKY